MNEYDEKWEQQINALLDGELGELQFFSMPRNERKAH